MNKHQQAAFDNPCRFAFETSNPKLAYDTDYCHVILTIAYGYE